MIDWDISSLEWSCELSCHHTDQGITTMPRLVSIHRTTGMAGSAQGTVTLPSCPRRTSPWPNPRLLRLPATVSGHCIRLRIRHHTENNMGSFFVVRTSNCNPNPCAKVMPSDDTCLGKISPPTPVRLRRRPRPRLRLPGHCCFFQREIIPTTSLALPDQWQESSPFRSLFIETQATNR